LAHLECLVKRPAQTAIFACDQLRIELTIIQYTFRNLYRIITRAVVDDEQFSGSGGLSYYRPQTLFEVRRVIVRRHTDKNV